MKPLELKTTGQIKLMAEGGEKLAAIRDQLARSAKPGVTLLEIDQLANRLITLSGGYPSFKMVPGYNWATCINVNEVVVHGIPDNRKLISGDVVGIDVGLFYKGWHTDTSTTVVVGQPPKAVQKFLDIGKLGLKKAINQARAGKTVSDISAAMQNTIEKAGYSVVRALTGHGIGRKLHEEPQVPCFVVPDSRQMKLMPGMVLAIEIMYNLGRSEVVYQNDDGWTIATADGKISGLFEETVAITSREPKVLTIGK